MIQADPVVRMRVFVDLVANLDPLEYPRLLESTLEQVAIQFARAGEVGVMAGYAERLTSLRPNKMLGWALRGFADFRSGGKVYADHFEASARQDDKVHSYAALLGSVVVEELGVRPDGFDFQKCVQLIRQLCPAVEPPGTRGEAPSASEDVREGEKRDRPAEPEGE